MADEKVTSITTYIIIVFIIGIFATLIINYADELNSNANADLSDNSQAYVNSLIGADPFTSYNASLYNSEIEDIESGVSNDNENDFSLDFVFAKKKASKLKVYAKAIFLAPEFLIVDIFQFSKDNFSWFINMLNFLWGVLIFVTFLFLIIGRR